MFVLHDHRAALLIGHNHTVSPSVFLQSQSWTITVHTYMETNSLHITDDQVCCTSLTTHHPRRQCLICTITVNMTAAKQEVGGSTKLTKARCSALKSARQLHEQCMTMTRQQYKYVQLLFTQ